MSSISSYCPLLEPIDYESLSEAYRICRWKWGLKGGFIPSSDIIKLSIKDSERVARANVGFCSSGGITVQIISGKTQISIDPKLYAAYQKPKMK